MPTILEILFYYYCEQIGIIKSKWDEEEKRAYELLEDSLSKTQKKLFNEWEDLHNFRNCEEIYFWFEFGFKKGAELMEIIKLPEDTESEKFTVRSGAEFRPWKGF